MSTATETPLNWYTGAADPDVDETEEWLTAFEDLVAIQGRERGQYLLRKLLEKGYEKGVTLPFTGNTPYINTIPREERAAVPRRPGARAPHQEHRALERHGDGGAGEQAVRRPGRPHLDLRLLRDALPGRLPPLLPRPRRGRLRRRPRSTSRATARPASTPRRSSEGRISEQQLEGFRRELSAEGGGLSSYPHPWLMPDFWEFPTVSMGLAPISAIYQARFNRYLRDRRMRDTGERRVWAFLGDGETDEPETLGAITLAARERLDNLTFVINCNLQRLDGPVRGNGKIVQELETAFRGAGWNVDQGALGRATGTRSSRATTPACWCSASTRWSTASSRSTPSSRATTSARDFFGKHPELLQLVENYKDEELRQLRRGGHDPARSTPPTRRRPSTAARRPSSWPRPSRATAWARPARAGTSPTSRRS